MMRYFALTVSSAMAIAMAVSSAFIPVHAVVVRHDRADETIRNHGERYAMVGRVLPDGGCTLISPTWAVTAAHVAANIKPGITKIQFGSAPCDVKRVVIHPEAQIRPNQPPEIDLALVELATSVKDVTPAELYRRQDELNQTVDIVGYGDFGRADTPLARTDGKRRGVCNKIIDAGPKRLFVKFDKPDESALDLEGIGGPGDSGGPALLHNPANAKTYIVGVSSASEGGKPGHYGVTDVYTRVSSYVKWIDETMQATVEAPPANSQKP